MVHGISEAAAFDAMGDEVCKSRGPAKARRGLKFLSLRRHAHFFIIPWTDVRAHYTEYGTYNLGISPIHLRYLAWGMCVRYKSM